MRTTIYGIGQPCVDLSVRVADRASLPAMFRGGIIGAFNDDPIPHSSELKRFAADQIHTEMAAGGSIANSLSAIAQLGGTAYLAGKLGDDQHGRFLLTDGAREGIQFTGALTQGLKTGCVIIYVTERGERFFLADPGASKSFHLQDLDASILAQSRFLAIEGYMTGLGSLVQEALLDAVQRARELSTPIALSLSNKELVDEQRSFLGTIARHSNMIIANAEEALAFTGADSLERAFAQLEQIAPNVVVTDGPNGAHVRINGERRDIAAYPAKVIDTTGAGDMFAGVLLYGLTVGRPLSEVLERASMLSAQVVEQFGARLKKFPFLDWK